jgi:hypothetical protein
MFIHLIKELSHGVNLTFELWNLKLYNQSSVQVYDNFFGVRLAPVHVQQQDFI